MKQHLIGTLLDPSRAAFYANSYANELRYPAMLAASDIGVVWKVLRAIDLSSLADP